MFEKIKDITLNIPEKKKWVDMVTAILTVPVLITVIASNLGNISSDKKKEVSAQTPQPTVEKIILREKEVPSPTNNEVKDSENREITPTTVSCESSLPDFEILSPKEGENIVADPLCITFARSQDGNFCPVVWAYRINNGAWSTYTDDPICLYNMASGPVKLEVKSKISVSGEEKTYMRNFTYKGESNNIQISPQPSATVTPTQPL